MTAARTSKGDATRERLLDAAVALFGERGFHATTLRDITERAGRSPGLAYRYFAQKEDFVVALYDRLADQLCDLELPPGTVGTRVAAVLHAKIRLVRPHRRVLGALAAALVDPEHALGVTSASTARIRDKVRSVVRRAVVDAEPAGAEAWVDPLYVVHLLVVLLVIVEPREGAAEAAVDLVGEVLARVPPVFLSAVVARAEPLWSRLFADPAS